MSLRLLNVSDGFQLWARRIERPIGDLLPAIDEAARAIASVAASTVATPPRGPTRTQEAMELYLKARQMGAGRWFTDAHSIELFESALRIAPEDPTILSGYSVALARHFVASGPDGAMRGKLAREVAERVATSAPGYAESWMARAIVRYNANDRVVAVESLKRALEIAPSHPEAQDLLGRIMRDAGRIDDGLALMERAAWLDPTLPLTTMERICVHGYRGEWARVDALDETFTSAQALQRFLVLVRTGLWRRAPSSAEPPSDAEPYVVRLGVEMRAVGQSGRFEPPQRQFWDSLISFVPNGSEPQRRFCQLKTELCAFVGDEPGVLDAIDRAVTAGLSDLGWMDRQPLFSEGTRKTEAFARSRSVVAARAAEVLAAFDRRM